MANMTGDAPSMASQTRQTAPLGEWRACLRGIADRLEAVLEAERDQLPPWLPVALGMGIAGWFILVDSRGWTALILAGAALSALGVALGRHRRAGRAMLLFGLALAAGCGLIWLKATRATAPVLPHVTIASMTADVESVQRLAARGSVRVLLRPVGAPALPPRVRVNIAAGDAPADLAAGDRIRLRARLMPPPGAALPGAYDFSRIAWFQGIGATGRGFAPVERVVRGTEGASLRDRLAEHIQQRLAGGAGAIATALATGDQGAMPDADAEAMRRAGLAHLLSVSGLHITAAVGFAMLIVLRLLALSPRLALGWPLLPIAAGAGALTGIGYTLLTGAEVPTVRSCVAALLVLAGLSLGREAITLRLVAAGALVVLLFWPESLVGASFQLSFAAVTAIVALHEQPRIKALLARRDESRPWRAGRALAGLLLTGLVVEVALAPIALFHFHRSGLYGAFANIVAIPLTTFVIMPLEALALAFDAVGLGGPFWWLTGKALAGLLALAHGVADAPGAVASLASMPRAAFALMVGGGLWISLWKGGLRMAGLLPLAAGAAWALASPAPDLLVTGDGKHLAVRGDDGGYALLRPRAGDYVQGLLAESAGVDGTLDALDRLDGARCGPDMCAVELMRGARRWRLLATRSDYHLPIEALARACREADIVVSDRRLPRSCVPRWIKADRTLLVRTGGLSIDLSAASVNSVAGLDGDHPWAVARRAARQ